jgi:hypothetical protein
MQKELVLEPLRAFIDATAGNDNIGTFDDLIQIRDIANDAIKAWQTEHLRRSRAEVERLEAARKIRKAGGK